MRCAMEIIKEGKEKLISQLYVDTISFCEDVLSPEFEESFSRGAESVSLPKFYKPYTSFGIQYYEYNCAKTYKIDFNALTSYLKSYCYTPTLKRFRDNAYEIIYKVDPQCLAN